MSKHYKFRNPEGMYFITCTVVGWIDVFSRGCYRDILLDSIRFCQQNKGLELFAWCVMSNHVHLIARAKEDSGLSPVIRDMKKYTSKQIIQAIKINPKESRKKWMLTLFSIAGRSNSNNEVYQFWKQDNKPIELYSNAMMDQKLDYIHRNPVTARIVDFPEQYLYSSARDYCGEKGLLEVVVL